MVRRTTAPTFQATLKGSCPDEPAAGPCAGGRVHGGPRRSGPPKGTTVRQPGIATYATPLRYNARHHPKNPRLVLTMCMVAGVLVLHLTSEGYDAYTAQYQTAMVIPTPQASTAMPWCPKPRFSPQLIATAGLFLSLVSMYGLMMPGGRHDHAATRGRLRADPPA